MKDKVVKELMKLGYSKDVAVELISKHIDVFEVHRDDGQPAKMIAIELQEAHNQE